MDFGTTLMVFAGGMLLGRILSPKGKEPDKEEQTSYKLLLVSYEAVKKDNTRLMLENNRLSSIVAINNLKPFKETKHENT